MFYTVFKVFFNSYQKWKKQDKIPGLIDDFKANSVFSKHMFAYLIHV